MSLECFHNLIVVVMGSNKTSSPLFTSLDGGFILFFDDFAMVCIEIGNLLLPTEYNLKSIPAEGSNYTLTFWRISSSASLAFPSAAAAEISSMILPITVFRLAGGVVRYSASQASRIFWYGARDRV